MQASYSACQLPLLHSPEQAGLTRSGVPRESPQEVGVRLNHAWLHGSQFILIYKALSCAGETGSSIGPRVQGWQCLDPSRHPLQTRVLLRFCPMACRPYRQISLSTSLPSPASIRYCPLPPPPFPPPSQGGLVRQGLSREPCLISYNCCMHISLLNVGCHEIFSFHAVLLQISGPLLVFQSDPLVMYVTIAFFCRCTT